MRMFRITVNGKVFDVAVEQSGQSGPVVQPVQHVASAPAAAPVAVAPRPAPHSAATVAGPSVMKSPLPGKVLKVHAAPGKSFKRGDTLLIIEAMKMENEILAPRDCIVAELFVTVNQSIKTGEPLLRLG
ncbi:MAG: biotin/lipoyl-containing protein [Candidatus Cryosericum sp.]